MPRSSSSGLDDLSSGAHRHDEAPSFAGYTAGDDQAGTALDIRRVRVLVRGAGAGAADVVLGLAMLEPAVLGIADDQVVMPADALPGELARPDELGLPRARVAAERVRAAGGRTEVRVLPFLRPDDLQGKPAAYDLVVDSAGGAAALTAAERALGIDADPPPAVTADELDDRLRSGGGEAAHLVVVDVRSRQEFDTGTIGGAVLAEGFGRTSLRRPELPRGAAVVVVDSRGPWALPAARLLRRDGIDASALERGMLGWTLRSAALAGGLTREAARVPLPLADIDQDGFRPNGSI